MICFHRHEIPQRVNGILHLICTRCFRLRPHPLNSDGLKCRRTQEGGEVHRETGIERERREREKEQEAIASLMARIETQWSGFLNEVSNGGNRT